MNKICKKKIVIEKVYAVETRTTQCIGICSAFGCIFYQLRSLQKSSFLIDSKRERDKGEKKPSRIFIGQAIQYINRTEAWDFEK